MYNDIFWFYGKVIYRYFVYKCVHGKYVAQLQRAQVQGLHSILVFLPSFLKMLDDLFWSG